MNNRANVLKHFLRLLPALLGWAALMLVLWGLIFLRLDDAPPANKLVIYTDCEIANARELMIRLEDACGIGTKAGCVFVPAEIKKIKLYTTSFFSALSSPLKDGDLFILSEEKFREIAGEYALLTGDDFDKEKIAENTGLLYVDPESGCFPLSEHFLYDPAQRYYICVNARSAHSCETDSAAFTLMRILLTMN